LQQVLCKYDIQGLLELNSQKYANAIFAPYHCNPRRLFLCHFSIGRFANRISYAEPASWVSRGIPDTSDLPLAQRDHITVRSRWPVCLSIRSNLFIYREEARLRSRPTACQYPYRRKANPPRPDTWWQPQIPCSPSRSR
jgi:hypothetical protein